MTSSGRRSANWKPWRRPTADPAPDPALTGAFAGCLPGGRLSGPLVAFASIPSTQVICRALGADGAAEGAVVLADHQTAGRGRRGRAWTAPPGSALLFSCLLRPLLPPSRWPEVALMAGCAVAEGLEQATGVVARLKWPNDVLVGHRKVAGILVEGVVGEPPLVVLGIGVNMRQASGDWLPDLASRAVSLAGLGVSVSREVLLAAVLARLAHRYDELLGEGFGPLREAWTRRAVLGRPVQGSGVDGVAVGLAPSGALLVRQADGTIAAIAASEEPLATGSARRGS